MASVIRKIHFFKVRHLSPDNPFSIVEAIEERRHKQFILPATSVDSAYLADDAGKPTAGLWIARAYAGSMRFALGTVRSDALPFVDDLGAISPLDIANKSLVEFTHFVFFQSGIVGGEFNFHGPRATRIADYFAIKCPTRSQFKLDAIANHDATQMLNQLREVQLVHLRVFPSKIPNEMKTERGLFGFLRNLDSQFDADNFEIILRPKLHSKEVLGASVLDMLKGLVGWPQMREAIDQLKVEGKTNTSNKREYFDLLSDKFVVQEHVTKAADNSRSVDSTDMYGAITKAYGNMEEELLLAAGIEL